MKRRNITPAQCRAARGLLDWTQQRLADESGVSDRPIRLFEKGLTTPYAKTLVAITTAFVRADVALLDNEGVAFTRKRRHGKSR
jgi:transcriptional regulator with XRE-family HTH domain